MKKKNCRLFLSSFSRILIEASRERRNDATVESEMPSTYKTSYISLELSIKYSSLSEILIKIGAARIMACGLPPNILKR